MSSAPVILGQDDMDNLSPNRIIHSNSNDACVSENPCSNQDVCRMGAVQKLNEDSFRFNNDNKSLQSSNNLVLNQKQNMTLTLAEECGFPPECLKKSGVVGASGDGLNNLLCDSLCNNLVSEGGTEEKDDSVKVLNNVNGDGNDRMKSDSKLATNTQSYAKVAQNLTDNQHATASSDNVQNETVINRQENCEAVQLQNGVYASHSGKFSGNFGDLPLSNGDIVDPTSVDSISCGAKMKALKETIGHFPRLNDETAIQNSISSNHVPNPTALNGATVDKQISEGVQNTSEKQQDTEVVSGEFQNNPFDPPYPDGYPSEYIDANTMGAKPNNVCQLRRETEKPPRMQKQRSQDRLLLLKQQQKQSFDSDTKSRESLSRESSFECLDSTGVDVHEFLINTLRSCTRDKIILLKLEHDMISFINDKTIDFMKFPPMTSYHRMLVHRVAAYFGMDHNVDETGKSVIINKTCSTRIPESRFSEHVDLSMIEQQPGRHDNDMRRRSILKRTNQSRSFDRDDMKGRSLWKDSRQRSIEEREEEYEKVRARIFNQGGVSGFNGRGMSPMAAARMAFGERLWSSTDMESMPSSMRRPLSRPLTTRASSYSSISVLARNNSITSNKTGSSSSVSSMPGGSNVMPSYVQNRQPQNSNAPRPTTPMRKVGGAPRIGDNDGTVYYSVPQQGQEVKYDIKSPNEDISDTWYQMSDTPEPSCPSEGSVIVPSSAPILLAVPAGYMLSPETVLCHPVTGLPYVSPEGYQLVYQTGGGPAATVPSGMSSPRVAQYYQVPPHASPQPPPMGFAPGQSYGIYHQQSPQKSVSIPQGSGGDYPVSRMQTPSPSQFTSMSYPQNSSTAAAYTAVHPSYSYLPSPGPQAMYRQSQEQMVVNQTNGTASQPNVAYQTVMFNTAGQIPQQTIVYNNQKMPQLPHQQPPGSSYSQYVFTSPPPTAAQQQKTNTVRKESGPNSHVMMNPIPGNMMPGQPMPPRPGVGHQPPPVPQQYPSYPQQPFQIIYSPPMQHLPVTPGSVEAFQQSNITKSSSQSIDDQLSEKMNAIVLKNTQSSASGSTNTATVPTSAALSISQQSLADAPNPCVTPGAVAYRPPPDQRGYCAPSPYPYGNPQQPQHVYLLPTNNAIPSGPSYRTYSQFMTSPQTPQVMGPGVNFVYLSPPPFSGVVGVENPTTPNAQMYQNTNMQCMAAAAGPTVTGTVNTNNNNAQVLFGNFQQPSYPTDMRCKYSQKEQALNRSDIEVVNNLSEKQKSNYQVGESNTSPSGSSDAEFSSAKGDSDQEKAAEAVTSSHGELTPVHPAPQIQGNVISQGTTSTAVYYQNVTTATGGGNLTLRPPSNIVFQPQGQPILTHPNQPLLIGSNVQHDFRATGMSGPPSYSPGVTSFYPGLSPSPGFIPPCVSPYMKCYLPATGAKGQKFSEVKVFPAQGATSPSPGLIAVQLPNQSQIQLVPASLSPQPIYYAQHNHPTVDIASSHQIHTENPPKETMKYPVNEAQMQDAKHDGEKSKSLQIAGESNETRSD